MNQSIIGDWLGLPGWQIFLSLAVAYLTSAAIIHWVCFHSGWRDQVHSFQGVVAPFMVSPGVIFALMLSFLASDVWARDRQALNDVLNERDAIRAVYDLSGVVGGGDGGAARGDTRLHCLRTSGRVAAHAPRARGANDQRRT